MFSDKDILSADDLCSWLGITKTTIHSLTRQRSRIRNAHPIPHLLLGKRLYFRPRCNSDVAI